MKIHEYQAKSLLKKEGIPLPHHLISSDTKESVAIAKKMGYPVVLKGQVHSGGRGKAGAVHIVKNEDDCLLHSKRIFSMSLQDLKIKKILVEECISIEKEYYISIVLDRSLRKNVLIISAVGGVDIEEVFEKNPEKILQISLEQDCVDLEKIKNFLALDLHLFRDFESLIQNILKVYFSNDAELVEINPLVLTSDQKWMACDAKMIIDDNALFRQKELNALREENESNALEIIAHRQNIPYVKLKGNIGIIGNGAGLVMTTMDEVSRCGGRPANFLDIGGGAQREMMEKCLSLIYSDREVKGIFINIFGGITRCDEVALGLIDFMKNPPEDIPVVLRLSGTRAQKGRSLVRDCEFLKSCDTMTQGARKIVQLTNF